MLTGAALFLAVDSMRPYGRTLSFTPDVLWMLAVYLAAALAEERFARGLTMRVATLHARPVWGYVASALMLLAITGSYALPPLGIVNMLLTAVLCAHLSATGHAGASVGLRCAWSWSSNALAAFPGGNAASQPVFRLYDVSENWLTGGANGLICGAWMTLILLALALWLFRQPLRALLRVRKQNNAATPRAPPRGGGLCKGTALPVFRIGWKGSVPNGCLGDGTCAERRVLRNIRTIS